jgi:hypothetical protein
MLFTRAAKLKELRGDWARFSTTELLFLPGELAETPERTLTDVENVVRLNVEFWQPTLDLLG